MSEISAVEAKRNLLRLLKRAHAGRGTFRHYGAQSLYGVFRLRPRRGSQGQPGEMSGA